MKKINNKGFAISTIIYSILIIAILIMGMLYSTIAFRKKTSSDFTHKVEEQLNNLEVKSYTICKKATSKHQDKYGTLINGDTLVVGAAFDCDVNGDGEFNSDSERFYYLSPENGTSSDNIVLIYYSNTYTDAGNSITTPNNNLKIAYDEEASSSTTNQVSPKKAKEFLPTSSELSWKNSSLIKPGTGDNQEVDIKDENGDAKVQNFSYNGYSARFPRLSELKFALEKNTIVDPAKYNFFFEGTVVSGQTDCTEGYWIEDVSSDDKSKAWVFDAKNKKITTVLGNTNDKYGVRPVIVVNKENVYYE